MLISHTENNRSGNTKSTAPESSKNDAEQPKTPQKNLKKQTNNNKQDKAPQPASAKKNQSAAKPTVKAAAESKCFFSFYLYLLTSRS